MVITGKLVATITVEAASFNMATAAANTVSWPQFPLEEGRFILDGQSCVPFESGAIVHHFGGSSGKGLRIDHFPFYFRSVSPTNRIDRKTQRDVQRYTLGDLVKQRNV